MSLSFKNVGYPALGALLALAAVAEPAMAAGNVIGAPGMGRGSAWTVYAFGNAQAVSDAFRALYNFSASGSFASIASMLAVIGILALGLISGFNGVQAKRLMGYIVGTFLLGYVMFGATNGGPLVVQVEVIDTVDNTWKAPVTVPAVVGIPAALISTAGHRITQQIEASFPVPDELKMSNGAPFNLASSMLSDASRARITDPNLASSLAYYVQDCFTMAVASGTLSAQVLLNSTDFLNDIRYNHDSVMVNTLLDDPVGYPNVVTCGKAWNLINATVNGYSDASSMLSNASAWSRTPALSVVNAAADSTAQWATNNGITNGASMVKQAAMLSAFKGAYRQSSAATGNSDFLTGLALSQAHETQVNGWITSAEVFNRTMGYIFAVLQVFVYAITPMILVAALIPGLGVSLLKNFGQILLWMALWQPMLAIVNFIILSMQQAELGGALASGGSMGFTLSNMGIISEKTANLRSAATFIGTMVPVLTWAMVKGGMDFSRFIGSAMGENLSAQAANTMTTGNYSLNQASMDSFTSNKHSIAPSGAWGSGFSSTDYSTGRKLDGGGTSLLAAGGQQTSMMVGANQATTSGGSTAQATNVTSSGGNTVSATSTQGSGASGAIATTAGQTESAVKGSNAGLNTGLSANADLVRKGGTRGDVVPGTGGLMPLGSMGGPDGGGTGGGDVPGQKGSSPSRIGVGANGGLTTAVSGQHMVADTTATTGNHQVSGNRSNSGSRVQSSSLQASDSRQASKQDGYQEGMTQSIQMGATLADRAELMRAQMRMESPAFGTSYMSIEGPQTPASDIERKANELMTPNAVPAAVREAERGVNDRLGEQRGVNGGLRGNADQAADAYRADGAKRLKDGQDFVENNRGAAGRGALVGAAQALRDTTTDLAPWATEALGVAKPNAPYAGKMPNGNQSGQTTGNTAPVSATQLQQAQQSALAGGDQRKKTPEEEARERVTGVAGSAAVQMPLAARPEAPTIGQTPAPVATAQPVTPEQPAMQPPVQPVTPVKGPADQNTEAAAQAQAQVQMAEMRAQRLGTQMREADNLLIAADSRPADEHLSIIHEAREITGRS